MATAKELRQEVSAYKKKFQNWNDRAKEIIRRYRDDHLSVSSDGMEATWSKYRLNLLYSNVQTITPTLYARVPKAVVERKFKDRDPLALAAAEIAERVGDCITAKPYFNDTMKAVVKDLLLPGRGVAWVRYEPKFEGSVVDPTTQEPMLDPDGKPIPQKVDEKVICEAVDYRNFGHNVAPCWDKVTRVWRIVEMSKKEAKKRFQSKADTLTFNQITKETKENPDTDKARIVELWDKTDKKVYWFEEGKESEFLDVQDDPLGLAEFFPCPKPLFSALTTDSLVPIADFSQYKNLVEVLDKLCIKRNNLIDSIRTVGARSGAHDQLDALLAYAEDMKLVPIDDWAGWVEKGGLKGLMDLMPIEPYVGALQVVNQQIEQVKTEIYEVTGIADIIRGNTAPSETATAQQIKGQFATLRIQERQMDVQFFARDLLNIMTEMSIEQFDDERIAQMVNLNNLEPQIGQLFPQALELLRSDQLRDYRIDIETDSTIAIDEQQDKQSRMEFVQTIGGLLPQAVQSIQQMPPLAAVFKEMFMTAARGFKVGRHTEFALEQALEGFVEMAMQPPPPQQEPPPDPQIVKAQMEQQIKAQEFQMQGEREAQALNVKLQELQTQFNLKQQEIQAQIAMKQQEIQANAALKEKEMLIKAQVESDKAQMMAELKAKELELKQISQMLEQERKEKEAVRKAQEQKKVVLSTDAMGNRVGTISNA